MDINHISSKIRSAVNWHGGKTKLARRIVDLITDHEIYLEPFAGGANVLLNKHRSPREILCDLNEELVFFYQFFVDNTDLFISKIREIPFSEESFLEAKGDKDKILSPLERAVRFFVINNQSMGAMGRDFKYMRDEKRRRGWGNYQYDLPATAARLRGVEIRCQNAFDTIEEFSHDSRALLYADPPYYPATRVSPKVYLHEMSAFDHLKLLKKVKEFSGKVIISGYKNPLYDQELADWEIVDIPMKNNSSLQEIKPLMHEILYIKPYWPF
jgi:DNA adenine methylase